MMQEKVIVRFIDETEGAFRYREVNGAGVYIHGDRDGALMGDVYLRKAAVLGARPDKITITIEY